MTTEMARLRVSLTITQELNRALAEKAVTQRITVRAAVHQALVEWAAKPALVVQWAEATNKNSTQLKGAD